MTESKTQEIVAGRGKVYGDPWDNFTLARELYQSWVRAAGTSPLDDYEGQCRHVVYMLCTKLARLAAAPDHRDTIEDIAGYAHTLLMCLEHREHAHNRKG